MTKQKKSFFERITGIKRIEEDDTESQVEIGNRDEGYAIPAYDQYDQQDSYDFSDYQANREMNEDEDYREPITNSSQKNRITKRPTADNGNDSEGQLTIDVYQTEDDIVIKSTIAGVKPEDLDVNINNDMVTIRGERKKDEDVDQENYYYQECYWGPFSRSVILPVEIVTEKAEATMKNGILTLRLPKADVTKTRKIQVRGF